MTFIPIFKVEIPERYATVVDSNYEPDVTSGRAVVCLTAVMNDGSSFGENLARLADERLMQTLNIFIKGGVSLVCVESMEGTRGRPDAMGAKVHERLRKGDVRVVGVDNLELETLMTSVWTEAQMSATRYDGLFADVLGHIEERASRLAPSLGKFLRLRREHEGGRISVGVLLKDLLELEEATRCYLPADIKKPLIAIRREAEMDVVTANAEQQELIERLKRNASEGVLDPERVTTFRKKLESGMAPSRSELTTFEFANPAPPQQYSSIPLAPYEAAALAYFRLRLGIDPGNLVLSLSGLELEAYQSRHSKDKDDPRESCDMAQILGISLNAYPNFCKFTESRQALRSIQDSDPYQVLSDATPKAFAYFEAEAFRGRDERRVMSCLTRWALLKKLVSLQLSPELYDQLVEVVDDAFLAVILESLQLDGITVAPELMASARRFDERRDFFISFYDSARKRASGMALGTLQQMDQLGVDKALLICLGFHRPTVKATWQSEQIPFWMLYPITRGSSSVEESK